MAMAAPALLRLAAVAFALQYAACSRGPSPRFSGRMGNVTAVAGEDVKFECRVDDLGRHMVAWLFKHGEPNNRPATLLAWDRKVFRSRHKYHVEQRQPESRHILTVKQAHLQDAGTYICQVNTEPPITQQGKLDLRVPPSINKTATSSDVEVREGHNVSLVCAASGQPPPTVIWYRKDRKLIRTRPNDNYAISNAPGPVLRIEKVSRAHMTEYICLASNTISPDESWTVRMHVLFPPTVLPGGFDDRPLPGAAKTPRRRRPPVKRADLGRHAVLDCRVEAWPRPNVYWMKDGDELSIDGAKWDVRTVADGRAEYVTHAQLSIVDIAAADYGVYTCVATNDQGTDRMDVELTSTDQEAAAAAAPPPPPPPPTAAPVVAGQRYRINEQRQQQRVVDEPKQNVMASDGPVPPGAGDWLPAAGVREASPVGSPSAGPPLHRLSLPVAATLVTLRFVVAR